MTHRRILYWQKFGMAALDGKAKVVREIVPHGEAMHGEHMIPSVQTEKIVFSLPQSVLWDLQYSCHVVHARLLIGGTCMA